MTDQERQAILQMVEDGKISAAEALTLIQALELAGDEEETPASPPNVVDVLPEMEAAASGNAPLPEAPMDEELRQQMKAARRWWPWAIFGGVVLVVLGAYGMVGAVASEAWFWLAMAMLPLLLGTAVLALAVANRGGRWLFVDVRQPENKSPRRILIALPLSVVNSLIGLAAGFSSGAAGSGIGAVRQALQNAPDGSNPLLVKVDGDDGERVTIFIA